MTPTLSGVLLQWSYLFQPFSANFVQYRQVVNLTLTATQSDLSTPYVTLPMVFANAETLEFTIPSHSLSVGTYYEFRLGFPFPTYTFYTNTIVAKTFDSRSPFVSGIISSSTNSSISMSWNPPEYSDGVIGYSIQIYYKSVGNGGGHNRHWTSDQLISLSNFSLGVSQPDFVFTCDLSGSCLSAYTIYRIDISVNRQGSQGAAVSAFVSTLQTVVPLVQHDSASIFLFGKTITLKRAHGSQNYGSPTPINATNIYPVYLSSAHGEISNFMLSTSTAQSIDNMTVELTMSEDEFIHLYTTIFDSPTYSAVSMTYGTPAVSVMVSYYCLSAF